MEGKRAFRTETSYAVERVARDAVVPFLRSRGFIVDEAQRAWTTPGQSQIVQAVAPDGESMRIRVRLCWRRDGRNDRESQYSAAQLAAKTRPGGWNATLDYLAQRDRDQGVTHTLFLQREAQAEVYAALVPSAAVAGIWRRQYEVSDRLGQQGRLGNMRKNHAANGHSPTIYLQDDREPDAHQVADVLWQWPGVVDLVDLPVVPPIARAERSAKYWRVLDAIDAHGAPVTVADVRAWLEANLPGVDWSDTRENLTHLTVNDASRRHYDRARASFRSDQGHERDVLFRIGSGAGTRYARYLPGDHGVFDILPGGDGTPTAVQVLSPSVAKAYGQAEGAVAGHDPNVAVDGATPIEQGTDARSRQLRAVVLRRGQPAFRERLMRAYAGRCAISGCDVADVLEAAHIVPYRGDHSHRVDNGLLLRADLHTLFDLGLLWIDADLRVGLSPALRHSAYWTLEGQALLVPDHVHERPHVEHLAQHRREVAGREALAGEAEASA